MFALSGVDGLGFECDDGSQSTKTIVYYGSTLSMCLYICMVYLVTDDVVGVVFFHGGKMIYF